MDEWNKYGNWNECICEKKANQQLINKNSDSQMKVGVWLSSD